MTATAPSSDRRLLPRLSSSLMAASSGDLLSVTQKQPAEQVAPETPHFDLLFAEWQKSQAPDAAAELLATGSTLGKHAELRVVADFVTRRKHLFTSQILHLAQLQDPMQAGTAPQQHIPERDEIIHDLKIIKEALVNNPKNAIAWMDRAQLHASIGQRKPAEQAVWKALYLAPANRFVLRTAARFFAHIGEKETGLEVLRRATSMRRDPWIISAEIALSEAAGSAPLLLKQARDIAKRDFLDPRHTSELNGALATFSMHDRSVGKPNIFFRLSLRKPTGNALAQAQWFANQSHSFDVPEDILVAHTEHEALALRARAEHRWLDVLDACRAWSISEPTSTRPLTMAGFLASVALNDGKKALPFTRRWMVLAPNSAAAWNNHVVALAYANRLDEAERDFQQIESLNAKDFHHTVHLATKGLLAYRRGQPDVGRSLYLEAMSTDDAKRDPSLRNLVLWHLLREEAPYAPVDFDQVLELATKQGNQATTPELLTMRETILSSYRHRLSVTRRSVPGTALATLIR